MEEEIRFLRGILLRIVNNKQIIILKALLKTTNSTLSSVLTRISETHNIPLSTLKFNAAILRRYNLIEFFNIDGKRYVRISQLGRKVLNLIEGEDEDSIYIHITEDLNEVSKEVKRKLRKVLRKLDNFHLHSSMTCIDILLAIMYHRLLTNRDLEKTNLILSKGHATPALYVVLEKFGMIKRGELDSISEVGSIYQTHALKENPLIKVSTGSLGQGLSVANGIALGMKMNGETDYVYVVVGDGETDEGQIWEAAATSSTYGLDNIILIIDRNGTQLSGNTEEIKRKEPLAMKWRAFGWEVIEITLKSAADVLYALMKADRITNWPKVIIARHG